MKLVATGILTTGLLAGGGCALTPRSAQPSLEPPPKVVLRFYLAADRPQEGFREMTDECGQPLHIAPEPFLTEQDVLRASVLRSPQRSVVRLEFTALAADRLERITGANVGKRLAVMLNDELLMSPVVRSPIAQGKMALDAALSPQQAEELARRLNARPPAGVRE